MSRKRHGLTLGFELDGGATNRSSASGLQRNQESSVRGKYQQQLQNYQQHEFTHTCNEYLKQICLKARHHTSTQGLPLRQALIVVSKILFVNELELLFLSCLLEELGWPLSDSIIIDNAHHLKKLLPNESPHVKCLELYLLLSAYSVKVYLNDSVKIFDSELSEVMPGFYVAFQAWGTKFARPTLNVNPKRLNRFFLDHVSKPAKTRYQTYEDLNNKVSILVENLPVPDLDSDYINEQEQEVKPQGCEVIAIRNEHTSHDQWSVQSMDGNRLQINDQNKLIDEMPNIGWAFRADSIGSNTSRQKWNYMQMENQRENLPLMLIKKQSFESDFGLRIQSEPS